MLFPKPMALPGTCFCREPAHLFSPKCGCYQFESFCFLGPRHLCLTSFRRSLVLDSTDILVGVKSELGETDPNFPNSGRIQVSVEWYVICSRAASRGFLTYSICFLCSCPSASPEYEGRGAEEINVELARFVERLLRAPGALNLQTLGLIPGRQCWVLYVDVMVRALIGCLNPFASDLTPPFF